MTYSLAIWISQNQHPHGYYKVLIYSNFTGFKVGTGLLSSEVISISTLYCDLYIPVSKLQRLVYFRNNNLFLLIFFLVYCDLQILLSSYEHKAYFIQTVLLFSKLPLICIHMKYLRCLRHFVECRKNMLRRVVGRLGGQVKQGKL